MRAALRTIAALFAVSLALAACAKHEFLPPALSQADLQRIAAQESANTGVPSALILAIVAVESGGNPRAVSPTGAQGLMQLTAATARRYGASNPFDPQSNVAAGARFLRDLMAHYHRNLRLTLAAWNVGEGAVDFNHGVPAKAEPFVAKALRAYQQTAAPAR